MNEIQNLAKYFDHTNLKNNLSFAEVEEFCNEAVENGFFAVCLQPYYVPFAVSKLKTTSVRVVSVVDFPYGSSLRKAKVAAVENLVKTSLDEIDIVMNLPAFLNKDYGLVEKEISDSLEICRASNVKLKVIIETGFLQPEEIALATRLLCDIGVDFVKTSTGILSRGASYDDVKIIRENLSGNTKIKASGGIRTLEQVYNFINLGVARIGTSASLQIIREYEQQFKNE
ncbi:deoxyribose-phosphate aldolase [Bacteroidetes/Chlorobi group bacterium Naka2016]|jgi:deoxyribose-phosphate aldolase|nr:MAG: deoxyribose-phosphate aldolase [Bacteroidetes/Chlorobi group bacterium Naka2016]